MRVKIRLISALFFAMAFCAPGYSEPSVIEIENINEIKITVDKFASEHGELRTLVVFDVDNTLLTMNNDLGSDAWYVWQRGLDFKSPASVSTDFPGLLDVQRLLYQLSDMRKVEPTTQTFVQKLIERGHPVMALTARGPESLSSTMRELKDQNYEFPSAPVCGYPMCVYRGIITGSHVKAAAESARGLFTRLPELVGENPRAIGYSNGIMMVAGQNKGAMLQLLMASSNNAGFEAIIFVDDNERNIRKVEDAFKDRPRDIAIFHYKHLEPDVMDFLSSDARQQAAIDSWTKVSKTVCDLFGRFCSP